MKSYYFWTQQAQRWKAAVDFGSPITAWDKAMHDEYSKAKREGRKPSMSNVKQHRRES